MTPYVRLHDASHFQPSPRAVSIPFTLERNQPLAEMTLMLQGGERFVAKVILDTGAAYYAAVLFRPFVVKHDLMNRLGRMTRRPEPESSGGDPLRVLAARPAAIALGPFRSTSL